LILKDIFDAEKLARAAGQLRLLLVHGKDPAIAMNGDR
jgi:hypothetical protein